MKTRRPMYASLPVHVADALRVLPEDGLYFFWSGKSKLSTAIGNARRSINRVCKLAGIENGHPHRFRDTFAVELLRNGASLHTVQLLLGHSSIRTMEKHYTPFVLELQQVIDAATAKLRFETRTKTVRCPTGEVKMMTTEKLFGGSQWESNYKSAKCATQVD